MAHLGQHDFKMICCQYNEELMKQNVGNFYSFLKIKVFLSNFGRQIFSFFCTPIYKFGCTPKFQKSCLDALLCTLVTKCIQEPNVYRYFYRSANQVYAVFNYSRLTMLSCCAKFYGRPSMVASARGSKGQYLPKIWNFLLI